MNNEEKIEAAAKKKEEGNALFKAGKLARASKRYEKVSIFIRTMMLDVHLTLIFNPGCQIHRARLIFQRG